MISSTDNYVDILLNENRKIQSYLRSKIESIKVRLATTDALLLSLERNSGKQQRRRRQNKKSLLIVDETIEVTNMDKIFKFYFNSHVWAPPLLIQPSKYSLALSSGFRWNPRATRSLKRQVERMSLETIEKKDPIQWQAVADAVNYESKASQPVESFQCYLYYHHVLASTMDPFSLKEDYYIMENFSKKIPLNQITEDIFENFGFRRSVFQVAERYRRLRRDFYEQSNLIENKDEILKQINSDLIHYTASEAEVILKLSFQLNLGRKIPWITEDSIRKALTRSKVKHCVDKDAFLKRDISAVMISIDDYYSFREARNIFCSGFQVEPLEMSEAWSRARWRYSQISIEAAAERLSSSLNELKERVLAKVLRWYETVYKIDYFKLSLNLFGQRDAALACFLISREYERQRNNITSNIQLKLL